MALGVHKQTFLTVKQQFYRTLGHVGKQGNMDLSHDVFLAAEAAAHQLPNNAYPFFIPP